MKKITVWDIVKAVKAEKNVLDTKKEAMNKKISAIDKSQYSPKHYAELVKEAKDDSGYETDVVRSRASLITLVEDWRSYVEDNIKSIVCQPMTSEQIRLIQGLQLRKDVPREEVEMITDRLKSSGAGAYASLHALKDIFYDRGIPTLCYRYEDALKSVEQTSEYLIKMIRSIHKDPANYTYNEMEFYGDYENTRLQYLSDELENGFWNYQETPPENVKVNNPVTVKLP